MRNQACWLQNSESLLIDRSAARFPRNSILSLLKVTPVLHAPPRAAARPRGAARRRQLRARRPRGAPRRRRRPRRARRLLALTRMVAPPRARRARRCLLACAQRSVRHVSPVPRYNVHHSRHPDYMARWLEDIWRQLHAVCRAAAGLCWGRGRLLLSVGVQWKFHSVGRRRSSATRSAKASRSPRGYCSAWFPVNR
jgi:hypothetical protein